MRQLPFVADIQKAYRAYPNQFWVLVLASFVDRLGGTMLYPFFTIYIADKFDSGLTTIAYVFVLMGFVSFFGSIAGGNISDQIGRKPVVIVGLLFSAAASIGIGLSPTIPILLLFASFGALFGSIGHPAAQAMIGDILSEKDRAGGFAAMRVVMNMAFVVGPILGGIIATQSFLALFILDAVTSAAMVLILATSLRETYKPEPKPAGEKNHFGVIGTLKSYRVVFNDRVYVIFILLSISVGFVYSQMYQTLPYFMYTVEGMPAAYYSYVLSINAAIVVFFQYMTTQRVKHLPPLVTLALACAMFGIGFAMYGLFSGLLLFGVAMVLVTIGEMMYFPTSLAFVTNLAPEDSRGRYMAAMEFGHVGSNTLGMLTAGILLDAGQSDLFWIGCGALSLLTGGAYYYLRAMHAPRIEEAAVAVVETPLAEAVAVGD